MGINTRLEKATVQSASAPAAQTSAALDITWTANEPTAGNTQTIADGDVPTVAELGQAVANLTAIVNELVADMTAVRTATVSGVTDLASLYAVVNAGE